MSFSVDLERPYKSHLSCGNRNGYAGATKQQGGVILSPFLTQNPRSVLSAVSSLCMKSEIMPPWRSLHSKTRSKLLDLQNVLQCSWSLGAHVWEEQRRRRRRSAHARRAHKSPLLKADALPAQRVSKTKPPWMFAIIWWRGGSAAAPARGDVDECVLFFSRTLDAIKLMWRAFAWRLIKGRFNAG